MYNILCIHYNYTHIQKHKMVYMEYIVHTHAYKHFLVYNVSLKGTKFYKAVK